MRPLLILAALFSAAAFACTAPACGCGGCAKGGTSLIETLAYALNEVGAGDNADVRTAIHLYQKEMRSARSDIPLEAFHEGNFYPEMYARNAPPARALEAQIDLFETIYLILDERQRADLPVLMKMYQHHMRAAPQGCGTRMCAMPKKGCATVQKGSCATRDCPPRPAGEKLSPKR